MSTNWLILLIGLAVGSVPTWWITQTYYNGVLSAEHEAQQKVVITQQEQNRLALLEYSKRIITAEADHDKNSRTIRNLSRELDGLRINFPTCAVSGVAESGTDTGGRAGAFSSGVDAAFADLQKETGRLIERCDELNVDAILANSMLK